MLGRAVPDGDTTSETAESILADELNKLSFCEREAVYEEIHGVGLDPVEETSQRKSASLLFLRVELDRLCAETDNETTSAFRRARELKFTYLDSDDVGMMFLRCECYDGKKAAVRLCHFAHLVYDMYGDKGLERRMKLSDIPEEEVAIMREGRCQVLPGRDRSGRQIYVHFFSESFNSLRPNTKSRILLYYLLSTVQDDYETQRRGIVLLFWMHNYRIQVKRFLKVKPMHGTFSRSIPLRICAIHNFLPQSEVSGTIALAKIMSAFIRKHKRIMRLHWGSPIESLYVLESFGISAKEIPLDLGTGHIDLAQNNRYLELCATREEPPKLSSPPPIETIIECPKDADILLGRGRSIMYHPGNVIFRKYVEFHLDTYAKIASRKGVVKFTRGVVKSLQTDYGVRFLREEPNAIATTTATTTNNNNKAWVEVSDEVARNKVRATFRDAVKKRPKPSGNNNSKQRHDITTGNEKGESQQLLELPSDVLEPRPLSQTIDSIDPTLTIFQRQDSIDPTVTTPQRQELWDAFLGGLENIEFDNLDELFQNPQEQHMDSSTSAFLELNMTGYQAQDCCSSFGAQQ